MKIKSALICAALLAAAVSVHAQGTVIFGNAAASGVTNIGGLRATSTTPIWIGLYYNTDIAATGAAGPVADNWLLSTPAIRIGPVQGVFSGGTRTLNGVLTGARVAFQVRLWDNAYADWNAAADAGLNARHYAVSPVMLLNLGGGSTPAPLITTDGGFPGLQMLPIVPEPSTLALGLLGAVGTLVLFRRRR